MSDQAPQVREMIEEMIAEYRKAYPGNPQARERMTDEDIARLRAQFESTKRIGEQLMELRRSARSAHTV